MDNRYYTKKIHYIDEAEIVRAEKEPLVVLTQAVKPAFFVVGVIAVVLILAIFLTINSISARKENMVHVDASYDLVGQNYREVQARFEKMGFTDITLINLNDTNIFTRRKKGKVTSISINGKDEFTKFHWFRVTDPVVISYH